MSKKNVILKNKAGDFLNPATSAAMVSVQNVDGIDSNVAAEIQDLRSTINGLMAASDALLFKGVLDADHPLPTEGYQTGWTYKTGVAGIYAGRVCEVGDMIICLADYVEESASDVDWTVVQTNIDGAVTGPDSAAADNLPAFDGGTGRVVKDSGIKTAEAADAVAKKHAHANKTAVLDKLSDDGSGNLLFDGARIDDGTVDVAFIEAGAAIPANLSDGGLVIEAVA